MPLYEHVFLVRQDAPATTVEALVEQFKGVIEAGGGSIAKVEPWGVKSLAYRVKKNRKAHFTLMNIDAPSPAVAEMERQMGINEDVIRFLTLKVDEHEEGPSAMLQKRDRDDRDRDGRPPRDGFRGGDREGGGRFGDRDGPRGDGPRGDRPPRPRRDEESAVATEAGTEI